MNPRKPLFLWQLFAQAGAWVKTGFAPTRFCLQYEGIGSAGTPGSAPNCCPFPMIWPSPYGVGPLFSGPSLQGSDGQFIAERAGHAAPLAAILAFASAVARINSADITTNIRGTLSCGKLSLFSSLQRRWPAACKTPAHAGLLAPLPGPWLPTQPMATLSTALSSAGLPALRLAPSRARSGADTFGLTAAAAGLSTTPATQGDHPFGWLFHFRPTKAALT